MSDTIRDVLTNLLAAMEEAKTNRYHDEQAACCADVERWVSKAYKVLQEEE